MSDDTGAANTDGNQQEGDGQQGDQNNQQQGDQNTGDQNTGDQQQGNQQEQNKGGDKNLAWSEQISAFEDDGVKKFAERFTSPFELAKTGLEFRQKLSNAITKPGKDASDEDVAAYYKALGVPESTDGYEFQLDDKAKEVFGEDGLENLNAVVDTMKKQLLEAKAPPEVASAILKFNIQSMVDAEAAEQKRTQDDFKKAEHALREKWGADEYDRNMEYAKRGYKQFGNDDFLNMIGEAKYQGVELQNHPVFAEVFANVGRKMGEGGLSTVISSDELGSMNDKMDELTTQAHAALDSGDQSKADRLFKERDKLSQQLYGKAS